MNEGDAELVAVELTVAEAKLLITALRQFEPYWPSGMDDLSRAELLAGVRTAIDHVVESLGASV